MTFADEEGLIWEVYRSTAGRRARSRTHPPGRRLVTGLTAAAVGGATIRRIVAAS